MGVVKDREGSGRLRRSLALMARWKVVSLQDIDAQKRIRFEMKIMSSA